MTDDITTPAFIIREAVLEDNVLSFKNALNSIWYNSSLAYSVKTNSLPWILRKMNASGVLAEVVSDEEYDLALKCGFDDSRIIFNGPIKGVDFIKRALQRGAIVNLDSVRDIDLCSKFANSNSRIGFRVNVPVSLFDSGDVEQFEGGFRFGFNCEDVHFRHCLETICESMPENSKFGLHLHCNSITRGLDVYRTIAKYAVSVIQKYGLVLDFVDLGGGFFGGVEGKPTPMDYLSAIREEFSSCDELSAVHLVVEPGSALIGSAADLVTTVVDAKDIGGVRIVTTDGSRLHIDPLWKKSRYVYSLQTDCEVSERTQVICGYTCMDHDRIMILRDCPRLECGDKITYHRVGAYSMTLGGMFIRYYPDVFAEKDGHLRHIRSRISVEDYIAINSVSK